MATCKGKIRKTGQPCKAPARKGRDYCRVHGGNVPVGLDHPNAKHGGLSKYLRGPLATIFEETQTDPELLNLHEVIVLYHTRLRQIVGRIPTGEAGTHWRNIWRDWREVRKALGSADPVAVRNAVDDMERTVQAGRHDQGVWDDMDKASSQLAKLIGQENARRKELNDCIPAHVVAAFSRSVLLSVMENVTDPDVVKVIRADFLRAMGEAEARAKGRE